MPRKTVAPPRSRQRAASAKTATPDLPLFALARQVRSWADTLLSVTGSAADIGLSLAQARVKDPKRKQAVAKAGTQLRRWREAAGLTARELSEAVGLGDAKLREEAEGGVATLPFEIVLRLAGVLGRNDPIPVAMSLTRQYNPELWKTLESLGVGKLAERARARARQHLPRQRCRAQARRRGLRGGAVVHAPGVRDGGRLPRCGWQQAASMSRGKASIGTPDREKAGTPKPAKARASTPAQQRRTAAKAPPASKRSPQRTVASAAEPQAGPATL